MRTPWVPCSTITPPLASTTMLSAFRIVDRRCAITTEVRPCISRSSASCTTRSLSLSSALVASSSSRIFGSLSTARAMAMRCFCPPDSWTPRSPTSVENPAGRRETKLCALAALAAASICSCVASDRP
mmetsp:Transcript_10904/g.24811  ORF Transcript_10904/g.24811 Transcript_10904/m.24811 type:complete len:128 (-) Transcript_10904:989-1372(-)